MRSLLQILALIAVTTLTARAPRAQEALRIHLDSTAQVVRGFGAANIVGWRPDMTEAEVQTAFGTGDGELGFSILRLRIAPEPSDWAASVPSAQAAQAMGATIIASPWTPPAEMKTNGSPIGGRLRDDRYDAYAAHLDAFVDYMASNGVEIYAVSVQNEPDIQVSYESCDWTPEEIRRFMAESAGAIGTRVIAPESFHFDHDWSDPTLNDPEAAANLDIVGGHIYGSGLEPYPLAKEKGKDLWMTEHLTESRRSADVWPLALEVGEEIQDVMFAGVNAYVWWYVVRYYGPIADGETSATSPDDPYSAKGEVTKKGHVMSQFARFVRPGFVRLHTDRPTRFSSVTATAYAGDGELVIVAINRTDTARDVSFSLEGGTAGTFRRTVTSETQDAVRLADVAASGGALAVTLGPSSATTFVGDLAGVATEAGAPDGPTFRAVYPNPAAHTATVAFTLAGAGPVRLSVIDALGREVATLIDGVRPAGTHDAVVDVSGLPPGLYLTRLNADGEVVTRPMVVAR
ncbi:T9SS type A sorting domain-containing protein [Rubrivirga marina]|uniref:Secretion system C-terminal sorting domain-containing protein n=1 Tax=Rubrivirga marina TaxID=1196024 RepID=A0A271IVA0_9BACT|nr:T9SS type A sorting domain-containing protein [Rubrivirga marina]PAP75047.1 hypothetical protein BSZ37_00565 [Rubrivirga marina]